MAEGVQGRRTITSRGAICPPPEGQRIMNGTLGILTNVAMSLLSQIYREGIALDDRAKLLRNGTFSRTVPYSILYSKVYAFTADL